MALKLQDVIDLARIDLNDADKTGYPDAELLRHAIDMLREALSIRPDLKLGHYEDDEPAYAAGSDFPLPPRYCRAVADAVIARAQSKEDEGAALDRAPAYLQLFRLALTGSKG